MAFSSLLTLRFPVLYSYFLLLDPLLLAIKLLLLHAIPFFLCISIDHSWIRWLILPSVTVLLVAAGVAVVDALLLALLVDASNYLSLSCYARMEWLATRSRRNVTAVPACNIRLGAGVGLHHHMLNAMELLLLWSLFVLAETGDADVGQIPERQVLLRKR
jgi:hypothetical protein